MYVEIITKKYIYLSVYPRKRDGEAAETLIEIVIVLILIIQSHAQSARDHVC